MLVPSLPATLPPPLTPKLSRTQLSLRLTPIKNESCVCHIDSHVFMKDEVAVLEHLLDPIEGMQFLGKRLVLPSQLCGGKTLYGRL